MVCLWLQSSPGSMEYDKMGLQYETSHTTVTFGCSLTPLELRGWVCCGGPSRRSIPRNIISESGARGRLTTSHRIVELLQNTPSPSDTLTVLCCFLYILPHRCQVFSLIFPFHVSFHAVFQFVHNTFHLQHKAQSSFSDSPRPLLPIYPDSNGSFRLAPTQTAR